MPKRRMSGSGARGGRHCSSRQLIYPTFPLNDPPHPTKFKKTRQNLQNPRKHPKKSLATRSMCWSWRPESNPMSDHKLDLHTLLLSWICISSSSLKTPPTIVDHRPSVPTLSSLYWYIFYMKVDIHADKNYLVEVE